MKQAISRQHLFAAGSLKVKAEGDEDNRRK
jgi:hypothetical protein